MAPQSPPSLPSLPCLPSLPGLPLGSLLAQVSCAQHSTPRLNCLVLTATVLLGAPPDPWELAQMQASRGFVGAPGPPTHRVCIFHSLVVSCGLTSSSSPSSCLWEHVSSRVTLKGTKELISLPVFAIGWSYPREGWEIQRFCILPRRTLPPDTSSASLKLIWSRCPSPGPESPGDQHVRLGCNFSWSSSF